MGGVCSSERCERIVRIVSPQDISPSHLSPPRSETRAVILSQQLSILGRGLVAKSQSWVSQHPAGAFPAFEETP